MKINKIIVSKTTKHVKNMIQINPYVRNENCTIYGAVVDFTVFISEHPKNKGLYKPYTLVWGALCFFDSDNIWVSCKINYRGKK